MEQFEEVADIIDYLNEKLPRNQSYPLDQIVEVVRPAFVSPLLDSHSAMTVVSKLVKLRTNENLGDIARYADLSEEDLSIYKFYILCGVRGELTEANIVEQVIERKGDMLIQKMVAHKDFPFTAKNFFYEHFGDTEYLPQEMKNVFVF